MSEPLTTVWNDKAEPPISKAWLDRVQAALLALDTGRILADGRPDVLSTMDATTQAKVAAAPVGAEFVSLNRPQGAEVWRKRSSGWACEVGDTGDVTITNLTAGLVPGAYGFANARRIGADVSLSINVNVTAASVNSLLSRDLPVGWRASSSRPLDATAVTARYSAALDAFTPTAVDHGAYLGNSGKAVRFSARPDGSTLMLSVSYAAGDENWPASLTI